MAHVMELCIIMFYNYDAGDDVFYGYSTGDIIAVYSRVVFVYCETRMLSSVYTWIMI